MNTNVQDVMVKLKNLRQNHSEALTLLEAVEDRITQTEYMFAKYNDIIEKILNILKAPDQWFGWYVKFIDITPECISYSLVYRSLESTQYQIALALKFSHSEFEYLESMCSGVEKYIRLKNKLKVLTNTL
jgi:hypothetical protein